MDKIKRALSEIYQWYLIATKDRIRLGKEPASFNAKWNGVSIKFFGSKKK